MRNGEVHNYISKNIEALDNIILTSLMFVEYFTHQQENIDSLQVHMECTLKQMTCCTTKQISKHF